MKSPRIWQLSTCRIARAISRQTAQKERHDADEDVFWRRQIRAAWWLNAITLGAAVVALGGLGILFFTLKDARRALVEDHRAWIAVRNAVFDQLPPPKNSGDMFLVAVTFDNPGKEAALNSSRYQEHFWMTPPVSTPFFIEQLNVVPNNTCDKLTSDAIPVLGVVWPGGAVGGYTSRGSNPPIPADADFLNRHNILGYHGCSGTKLSANRISARIAFFSIRMQAIQSLTGYGGHVPASIKISQTRLFYATLTKPRRRARNKM